MSHTCESCDKEFTYKPWTYADGKNTYCSDECRDKVGPAKPSYGNVNYRCSQCKQAFNTRPFFAVGFTRDVFCQAECRKKFCKEPDEKDFIEDKKENQDKPLKDIFASYTFLDEQDLDDQDNVSNPKHYNQHPSGIECIRITEHFDFLVGNVIKYVWRANYKNGIEDLKKAQWYLAREIAKQERALKDE